MLSGASRDYLKSIHSSTATTAFIDLHQDMPWRSFNRTLVTLGTVRAPPFRIHPGHFMPRLLRFIELEGAVRLR